MKNAGIGVLPLRCQQMLRTVKRKFFPNRVRVETLLVSQGLKQIRMLKRVGLDPAGKDILEIGTGWAPAIPLLFSLAGSRSTTFVDTQRLMDHNSFLQTCEELKKHLEIISKELSIPKEKIAGFLNLLTKSTFDRSFNHLNYEYLAPYDLIHKPIKNRSFDIIISRAVFEHIPPGRLRVLTQLLFDLLKKGGAMCHIIDNSDHWEHKDKRINRVNFLKYSKQSFAVFSKLNPLDYQNRLRHSQYIRLFETSGFDIVLDESKPDKKTMDFLGGNFRIHSDFKKFSNEELATLTSFIVAKKRKGI